MSLLEMIEKRNVLWNNAKSFVNEKKDNDGILSDEDIKIYNEMEDKIKKLTKAIERERTIERMENDFNQPINHIIAEKPEANKNNFWDILRTNDYTLLNSLKTKVDTDGGYLVPDEYEKTLITALNEANIFRKLAKVIQTASGERKIPVVANHGTAAWLNEESLFTESDDKFKQVTLNAHKLGTLIKVSEELLNDSVFNIENYISNEFARRIGEKEEEAFFGGDGINKPLGILTENCAEVGVTAKSATAISADEIIDLFYALKPQYRNNAVWIMNDATVKAIRKLKDTTGQYLWQQALMSGTPDTLLGRPVYTSEHMPIIAKDQKTVLFGDLSYYWIADRQGKTFKRLNELYAPNGQVGFLAYERVDGKLILNEAVKVLKQASV